MSSNGLPPFFYEIFHPGLPRLGVGDDACTLRALDILTDARRVQGLPDFMGPVLDIGCGNGPQTLVLAENTGERLEGPIIAVDFYQPFLDELSRRAEARGLLQRIVTRRADMAALMAEPGDERNAYDLVWSEGALFVMGFLDGLRGCRNLLAPAGMLAASELVWLRPDVPDECREFFAATYPSMLDVESILNAIGDMGYTVPGHFIEPESAWENLYGPLGERVEELALEHADNADNMALIESVRQEIDIRRRYAGWFGYLFLVLQRD